VIIKKVPILGTSLKVLDYMAHHVPVIATSIAIRGLESGIEKAVLVEDDTHQYHKYNFFLCLRQYHFFINDSKLISFSRTYYFNFLAVSKNWCPIRS